jgi:rubredoxin
MATAVAMCAMQSPSSSVVVGAHSMTTPPQGSASTTPVSVAGPFRTQQLQSTFRGTALLESSIQAGRSSVAVAPLKTFRLLPAVRAKTAGASRTYETEVDKPLGLTLGQNPGGRVVITAVDARGNAAKAGLKAGDQVIYTSSFFGDELWPADKLGFTKTAINAKPDSVYFVVNRGADVDVKRLPKRPAPPRFGRKLTEAQKARATHVCLDCGYIYTLSKPFEEQPDSFLCPQCQAPKKRFAGYDPETGRALGGGGAPISVLLGVLAGAVAVGALVLYGFQ